jgi:hypothetical protein
MYIMVFIFKQFYGTNIALKPGINLRLEVVMKCHRCGGIMVFEKFYGACEEFFGWRCVLCGEIVDQVILENRHGKQR